MNKDELPNVYANKIDKEINNVQKVFYGNRENKMGVNEFLDKLYDSGRYVYKASLEIITKGGKSIEKIAMRTKDYLLTLSNKKINISDIKSIKEVK